tara:strand:+ start:60542 stop:61291 length:750 start_codon:yes stop_codon:yes gene_type:complete
MKNLLFMIALSFLVSACGSDDDNTPPAVAINLNFSQTFDNTAFTNSDLSTTIYTNEMEQELTISRLRYLISKMELKNSSGETYPIGDYHIVDVSNAATLSRNTNASIPEGTYTLSFIYGFKEEDNVDGAYPDLNAVSWNWPAMLGGGYHFLQMDGNYNVNTEPAPFNFHNGTARVSEGVFEQNFVRVDLTNPLQIEEGVVIAIQMDIAEWFKNPNIWDFNVYNTSLMPNYEAQKLMQENAATVFSASVE